MMNVDIGKYITPAITVIALVASGAMGYGVLNNRVENLEEELSDLRVAHHALHEKFDAWRIEASEGRGRVQGAAVEFRDLQTDVRDDLQPSVTELQAKYRTFIFPVVREAIRNGLIQG